MDLLRCHKIGTNNILKDKQARSKISPLLLELKMHKLRFSQLIYTLKTEKQGVAAAFIGKLARNQVSLMCFELKMQHVMCLWDI